MPVRELEAIAAALSEGRQVEPVTVRTFLSWFGVKRRGFQKVDRIRKELDSVGLVTVPDFEGQWIDSNIEFAEPTPEAVESDELAGAVDASEGEDTTLAWVSHDPTYRISKLEAANAGVTFVTPDATLTEAATIMMARGYSQLPVMTSERDVKGMLSWTSIGYRTALSRAGSTVRELMDTAYEVRDDISIFEAISLIVQHDYVLVRGSANKVTGIVTASDLSLQFRTLTEPFLLLSEIENLVRNMIGDKFTLEQLRLARDPNSNGELASVADLSFGEYIRLLENPQRWSSLGVTLDRVQFCKDLEEVRRIRNDVMHFDPDGITPEDLNALRDFTTFLKRVASIS